MTVELLDQDATDAERAFIAWLAPLGYRAATERMAGDPYPFVLVTELTAGEDDQQMSAFPLISLRVIAETIGAAKAASARVHRRMLALARDPLQDIVLADSTVVSVLWLETEERFHTEYYSDTTKQRCARYRAAIPFTDIEGQS